MKTPRISIHALMAAIGVIALDCMIARAVSARPEFFTADLTWLLLASLPMAHILAVGAALLARGPIRARPFLLGFEVVGILAVLVTSLWRDRIMGGVESVAHSTGAEAWVESLPELMMMTLAYAIVVTLFLVIQLIAALAGGWLARSLIAPREAAVSPRSRLAPPLVAVAILAVPALAVVGYLRWVVDPQELRRPAGSVAVVDLAPTRRSPSALPKGSPLIAWGGTKVRIDRDGDPCEMELFTYPKAGRYVTHIRDYRKVRVTLLDGDRAGEVASVPHVFLRPISEAAAPVVASTVVPNRR